MILPVVVYGDPVLRKIATDIKPDFENLSDLIRDMFETMYNSKGVGIAAPQIGKSIRLFIIDASPFAESDEDDLDEEDKMSEEEINFLKDFKKVFINPRIIKEEGEEWKFNEGCLSIPKIREDVTRKQKITLEYFDENFNKKSEEFTGIAARIIQHEYDHIEGKLFIDRISPLRRKLISGKLNDISKGKINTDYKIKVYQGKK